MNNPTILYESDLREHYSDIKLVCHRASIDPLIGRFSFSPQKVKKISKHHRQLMENRKQVSQMQEMIITSTSSRLEAFITDDKMLINTVKHRTNAIELGNKITQYVKNQKQIKNKQTSSREQLKEDYTNKIDFIKNKNNIEKSLSQKQTSTKKFPVIQTSKIDVKSSKFKKRFLNAKSIYSQQISLPKMGYVPILQLNLMNYDQKANEFWIRNKKNIQQQPLTKIQNKKTLTAKNYLALNVENLMIIAEYNSKKIIQIASLTKIMTCYLCILLCKKYNIDKTKHSYRVADKILQTPGTSACLQAGDVLTLQQLLYGLMLPSGNDAALCIAECVGKQIIRHTHKNISYHDAFIEQMNCLSRQLSLQQTWSNCSGLITFPNYTTARAITILAAVALHNQQFSCIVQTKEMEIMVRNDRYGLLFKKVWKNTNRLLWKGFTGVKTGTTQTAGPCLMSIKEKLLIAVFNCQTPSKRFSETVKLYQLLKDKVQL